MNYILVIVLFLFILFLGFQKSKRNDRIQCTTDFIKFTHDMMSMFDSISTMAIWMKDTKDCYVYADDTLRNMLFNGLTLDNVQGQSDLELKGLTHLHKGYTIDNLKIEDLKNIKQYISHNQICNITDVIVRSLEKECYFIEIIENYILKVIKTPTYRSNKLIGTSGILWNITHKNNIIEKLDELEQDNKIKVILYHQIYYFDDCDMFYMF